MKVTVEDDDGGVVAIIGVGRPDAKGVCPVEVAERGGYRYSGFYRAGRGRRQWLSDLKLALRSVK